MNRLIFSLLLVFCIYFSYAQNRGKLAYSWNSPVPFVSIPDEFKNENAVAIYNVTGVKNESRYGLRSIHFIKRKIRILTANGLMEYSNIVIRKRPFTNTTILDARTIKKDGSTVLIQSSDIKILRTYNEEQDIYYDEYRISIPGVEIGDEIEYLYINEQNGISIASDVYLHTDIACLQSTFELIITKGFGTETYGLNGMPEPSVINEEYNKKISWTLNNLPSIKMQNFAIPDHELPYIKINVTMNYGRQWSDLYKAIARDEYDNKRKSLGLEKYFQSFKSNLDTLNNLDKVRFFVNKMNTEFTIMDDDDDENAVRPVMYFIKNKKTDMPNLRLFYKYMFYYLNIPYETCFGKNRYAGDLYPDIVNGYQISHLFFSFSDESGTRHFLFLSDSKFKIHVDERPYQLEDTQVIYLKKDDPFSDDLPIVQINAMNHLPSESNMRAVNCSYQVSPDWNKVNCDIRISFTGNVSFRNRRDWLEQMDSYNKEGLLKWLDQGDNQEFDLDTVYIDQEENNFPFKFEGRIKSKEKEVISSAGETISSLKVSIPLKHDIIPTYTYKRFTDMYVPYLYTDELTYYLQFPSGVTIVNEKDLAKKINNAVGAFTLEVTKISDSIYKVSSRYKISTRVLKKENYNMLVDLNDAVEQSKELNVLYKKL